MCLWEVEVTGLVDDVETILPGLAVILDVNGVGAECSEGGCTGEEATEDSTAGFLTGGTDDDLAAWATGGWGWGCGERERERERERRRRVLGGRGGRQMGREIRLWESVDTYGIWK